VRSERTDFAYGTGSNGKTLSGRTPFVPVMQATDFGNRNNFANGLYGSWIR